MKSAVETLSPTRAKLTVEVPFEELKPSLDKAYKQIAQQINVPGFRRGKVPPMVIDRQVGRGAVLEQAINEVVPQKYMEAIQENSIEPLSQPEIEVTKLEDNDVVEFTAELDVKPEFELPDYSGVEASVEDVAVSDEDVAEQVQALRERFGTLTEVDRAAADGDFVTIDLAATQDGEAVEGAQVSGMSYQVGRGGMLDGLDEALAGMEAGEEKTFSSQLVGGDLVGEDVDVAVTVTQVQEQELPELDDEFAQMASEFDTVDELTEDVRERLQRGKRLEQAAEARDAVLEVLVDQVDVPLPDTLVADELNARRQSVEQQLMMSGLTMEKYLEDEGQTVEEFEAELERRVRDALVAQFILDEIAKKEEVGVEQQDLSDHILRRAQASGQDPQEFANHMFEHNHIPELVQEILRGKALATVVESAKVTDGSGNHVELANLRPDGTIGEPEAEASEQAETAGSDAAEPADEPAEESEGKDA
ncbi:trigger factor [Nocardioides rotundus]|uniref:trigger factor n=1 Tax=Nocardioides rotundus TaxID=1774216 RepID=UPI001CBEEA62|nr:trigger factor [Nocardioides rotundus]UAL28996.1 trigger factor [Nocardioides rotundus]